MRFFVIILFSTICVPQMTLAQTYRHHVGSSLFNLKSKEGTTIILSGEKYQSGYVGDSQIDTLDEIHVTISGPTVKFHTNIRLVIVQGCYSGLYGWPIDKPTLIKDLQPVPDGTSVNFTASFDDVILIHSAIHGGEWIDCSPQVSVVVDGAWQTDPVNGTHNFVLKF